LEIGGDGVVAVHGDGAEVRIDIGSGAHVASPVNKAVGPIGGPADVDDLASVIGKGAFTRGTKEDADAITCMTSVGAGDGEVLLRYLWQPIASTSNKTHTDD
jgi:hypothetical protein